MKNFNEVEIKIGKVYLTRKYVNGFATDITVQESDGTILFSGDYEQANQLFNALFRVEADNLKDEQLYSNCCGVEMDEDNSFCPGCHEHAVAEKGE